MRSRNLKARKREKLTLHIAQRAEQHGRADEWHMVNFGWRNATRSLADTWYAHEFGSTWVQTNDPHVNQTASDELPRLDQSDPVPLTHNYAEFHAYVLARGIACKNPSRAREARVTIFPLFGLHLLVFCPDFHTYLIIMWIRIHQRNFKNFGLTRNSSSGSHKLTK